MEDDKVYISLRIRRELFNEVLEKSRYCLLSPQCTCEEIIESWAAQRRLDKMDATK